MCEDAPDILCLWQTYMLGQLTINSCAGNLAFFAYSTIYFTNLTWFVLSSTNIRIRRTWPKCAEFVRDAPHLWRARNFKWAKFGASAWMCQIFGDATLALCAKLSIFINPALLFFWRRICWTRQTYILRGTFDAAGFGECSSFFFWCSNMAPDFFLLAYKNN